METKTTCLDCGPCLRPVPTAAQERRISPSSPCRAVGFAVATWRPV